MAGVEGSAFGKYYLLRKIASGGMGEIFLAKLRGPVGFEKLLVIKRILANHVENHDFLDMFFAEARVAAQLSHSNIVQIHEMGEVDNAYFIGMEYVNGKSLRDVIDRARARGECVHPAHAIEIIAELCDGMAYAHNARDMTGQALGIIHRDLNPHNVLVSYGGEVKIIDFGIAKSEMNVHKTETGTIKGKFVYMSPEQSAAEELDKRSDIFSIGICLYETLTFVNPFARSNVVLSLDAIQRKEPPPVSETDKKLAAFDAVLKKALAKKREERYGDCAELAAELRGLLRAGAVPQAPQPLGEWMSEIFEGQIESERRMIIDTDQANTVQLEAMREARHKDHRSGSAKWKLPRIDDESATTETPVRRLSTPAPTTVAEVAALDASGFRADAPSRRSRLPFVVGLAAIVVATLAGALVVTRYVRAKRAGLGSITEIAPIPLADGGAAVAPVPQHQGAAPEPSGPAASAPLAAGGAPSGAAAGAAQAGAPTAASDATRAPPPGGREEDDGGRGGRLKAKRADRFEGRAEPAAGEPPAPGGGGSLRVSTVPPVPITLGGASVGQTVRLKAPAGTLVLGTAGDAQNDPFKISIRYSIADGVVSYAIESEPWAIVRTRSGIGLGRTPLPAEPRESAAVYEFVNPRERRQLRVTLHFAGT